jgi:hypothetical protein
MILILIGPFKFFILQPPWNANYNGPSMLRDEEFERIKFLHSLNAKSGVNIGQDMMSYVWLCSILDYVP